MQYARTVCWETALRAQNFLTPIRHLGGLASPSDTISNAPRQQTTRLVGLLPTEGSISPPQLLISDRKDVLRISAYGSHDRPLWLLRRSSVLLTSNVEVVALLACTILMVGSILKSAADQIELGELITTCQHIQISIVNWGS